MIYMKRRSTLFGVRQDCAHVYRSSDDSRSRAASQFEARGKSGRREIQNFWSWIGGFTKTTTAHDADDCGHCRGCLVINYVACGAWQCASENLAIVMKVAFRCLETGNETYDVSQFVLYWNWFENLRVVTSRIIKSEWRIKVEGFPRVIRCLSR